MSPIACRCMTRSEAWLVRVTQENSSVDNTNAVPGSAAALLAKVDWASHALGPRAEWPVALTTMLHFLLASPESM